MCVYVCVCVCVVQNNCSCQAQKDCILLCKGHFTFLCLKNCSEYSNTVRIHISHKVKRFFRRLNASFSVWYKNIFKISFCCCSALQKFACFFYLTLKFKQVSQAEPQWCGIAKKNKHTPLCLTSACESLVVASVPNFCRNRQLYFFLFFTLWSQWSPLWEYTARPKIFFKKRKFGQFPPKQSKNSWR